MNKIPEVSEPSSWTTMRDRGPKLIGGVPNASVTSNLGVLHAASSCCKTTCISFTLMMNARVSIWHCSAWIVQWKSASSGRCRRIRLAPHPETRERRWGVVE